MLKRKRIGALIAALVLTNPLVSHAQWTAVGPPPWTSTSIQTTGGITYFLHSATLPACYAVATGPVARTGTNLSLTAAEMWWAGPCVFCADCDHTQTSATVLGALPAGSYRLFIYSYPFIDPLDPPPFPPPSLWQIKDFQVPALTGSTLEIIGDAGTVRIRVRGVPAATYVLEGSTNAVNWTSVRTNIGGPCTFTNHISTGEAQFFRARVVSGSVNTP